MHLIRVDADAQVLAVGGVAGLDPYRQQQQRHVDADRRVEGLVAVDVRCRDERGGDLLDESGQTRWERIHVDRVVRVRIDRSPGGRLGPS